MAGQEQAAGCVLFADVSGSTKLYEAVGDAKAHAAIDSCVKLFAVITERNGGRVIKTIGDEIMSVFPTGSAGGRAATEIQKELNAAEPVGTVRLGVRIGLHFGPLVERDGDVFGDTVNLSARLTEMASRNQIITSLETVEGFEPILKMDCRRLYSIPVKGKEKEVDICEILWSETDEATTLVTQRTSRPAGQTKLRLVYRGRTVELPTERKSIVLGRDATADLVIADRMASRAHCEIEFRSGKFIIADRSANGTWVTADNDKPMVLRREESMLRGHGFITLGAPRETATELVEYFCE
jgi:adenylate cyclase